MVEEARWDLLSVLGAPDSDELGVVHLRMSGRVGGVPLEQTGWQAIESRAGKVSWWGTFRTEDEALEAVRLRE
jgi:hypothetical protein